ncbi:SIR2 family protein [Methylocella sp.]|uniref:SIR2 family protein n=1 Tax=Methylocella sp. TaxID=1978226 RepID=UPI003783670F
MTAAPLKAAPREKEDVSLSLDAFVRSIGVRRAAPHALFLGAGASVSSGIPSAQSCIWEWKRDLFVTNNPGLEEQFAELSLPSVQRRVQQWLDAQSTYPQEGADDEYGFYIRACFPIADDRRAFFQEKVRGAQPHIGYRLLCHLAKVDLICSVWSTNFDGLPARAAANFSLTPFEVGIDTQDRVARPANTGELLCVSLHGDYRYDDLKNTTEELQRQEEALRAALIDELRQRTLIVCGYSGRDHSIMEALQAAYAEQGTGALYWCGYGDGDVPEPVARLIAHARARGRQAFYVPALGFDDLMTRLALHCLESERREAARKDVAALAPDDLLARQPFQVAEHRANTLIKSNAFEIDCPAEVLSFNLKAWPPEKVWTWVREQTGARPVVAVPFKGKILAFGTVDDIKDCFGENIKGPVERTPISPDELRYEDGAIVGLMREALVRSMAHAAGVETDGQSELWLKAPLKKVRQDNLQCHAHESVIVFLRRVGGTQYVVLRPSIRVLDQNGAEVPYEVAGPVKLGILGYQHNKPFNTAMNKWRGLLFPKDKPSLFEFPTNSGSSFMFRARRSPVFAQIGLPHGGPSAKITQNLRPLIKYNGLQLAEPTLLFCDKRGTGTNTDTHPVRGLAASRPFDYPLTLKGLAPSLRIGVICPRSEAPQVRGYLQKANQGQRPADSERDYLVDFPGFQQAYGLPIEIPEPGAPGWAYCAEPSGTGGHTGALSVAQQITGSIEALRSSYAPHVVLVFFPRRWDHLRGYRNEHERFDVHDFVKAYAVQRGVATQFLTEDTLSDTQQCRVWWWLSLALYVKGMRTPWVLSGLDEDTAYVGLGFSIDRNAVKGNHVVLGCSHIYSARGEGLQYRLSKVENPIMRGKNPFMSRDDARRTGETIRQLFFDARMKLPRHVVLHKRTPFLKDEREGLLDGLGGVSAIDMLEIVEDHAQRYVASMPRRDGTIDEDNYPVRRGTVMKLDDFTALLWVHGATAAVNPSLKYFQGKRRIPAPLTLRRHAGATPLDQLAAEILGLSKMNWNTFDLYTKFPATLQSSGEIARIGSLLQRFGASSYDYRLFI